MGWTPSSSALARDMTMTAAPPSEIWLALPAVMVPSLVEGGTQLGQRLGRGLGPDALVGVDDQWVPLRWGTSTGTISSANLPSLMAAAARSWDRALKASCRSRDTPSAPL